MRRRAPYAGLAAATLLLGSALCGQARARTLDLGDGLNLDYKLTLNYGLALRTQKPSNELINGPIDTLQVVPANPGQQTFLPILVTHTGLPTTVNEDDGDRNFDQWKLIHNRLSALLETQFTWNNYGALLSADGFYDQVYNRPNDNTSDAIATATAPSTSNKYGNANQFTEGTRYYDGRRIRLLDGYVYGSWDITDNSRFDLRAGKQLAAWGESLFFSGIASTQAPADATKAFVPGAEVKEILLPVNQISASLTLGSDWTLLGQYKLDFKPNEIFPLGDYLSTTDAVGPGASFVDGAYNPLYLLNGKFGISAPAIVRVSRLPDAHPSNYGQYGAGLRYQISNRTTLGLYWLRYHDTNPSVVEDVNYSTFGTLTLNGQTFTLTSHIPGILDEPAPADYYVRYFDGIDLAGLSFSSSLWGVNLAGELNYRQHASVPVQAVAQGVIAPMFERGRLTQALLSAIYVTNPHLYFDDLQLVGEAGFLHVNGVHAASDVFGPADQVSPIPGIVPVGNGQSLLYSRNAWGIEGMVIPVKHDVFQGWDLSTPINLGGIPSGNPSMPGAFGAYSGQGDYRFSIAANLQYLSNLQFGIGYNLFFGSASKNIGASSLKQNPYVDRDYLTFNLKYSF
jgi:hypothetical protein